LTVAEATSENLPTKYKRKLGFSRN